MKTILITGANRGIGYEMAKQSLTAGHRVFATCRRPEAADQLHALADQSAGQLTICQADVADDQSVAAAFEAISAETDHLDILINNAGVNHRDNYEKFVPANMVEALNINAVGAMRMAHAFGSLLRHGRGATIVNISSQLGSLQVARAGFGGVTYNTSKAAMNMISRHLAFDLAADQVTVISMHPGWVQTDMGGKHAAVTVPDSAAGILNVTHGLTMADSGEFFIYNGEKHLW